MGSQPIWIELGKFLWEILAGKSFGKILKEILVGKSCGKILQEILVGKSCGKRVRVRVRFLRESNKVRSQGQSLLQSCSLLCWRGRCGGSPLIFSPAAPPGPRGTAECCSPWVWLIPMLRLVNLEGLCDGMDGGLRPSGAPICVP